MKVLITGACGFVGAALSQTLRESVSRLELWGFDNLSRPGSEENRRRFSEWGRLIHGDVRMTSDLEVLPAVDWVIDAAAYPSVLAGFGAGVSSRQLMEGNLNGTQNLLEYCRRAGAGLVLLSTSRVYSIAALSALPLREVRGAFQLDRSRHLPPGVTPAGITEEFSTSAPVSLYGASKLASEILAFEYGAAFGFPVWVNRCGVLAGGGQFGTAEQGIFSYWLHAHAARRPLRYTGFGGKGWQVRDALHPRDLGALVLRQMACPDKAVLRPSNVGGGTANAMSLAQLTAWCDERFGRHAPDQTDQERPYDIGWLVMDSSRIQVYLGWSPEWPIESILDEIASQTAKRSDWLALCGA